MRFHSNTEPTETVAYLRDAAIQAKSPPAVIDALDMLAELESQLEERDEELNKMEATKDDLYDELENLVSALQNDRESNRSRNTYEPMSDVLVAAIEIDKPISRNLASAQKALERHKP